MDSVAHMARLPRLVVFDLDDTVWTPEMWEVGCNVLEPFGLSPKGTRVRSARCLARLRCAAETNR